ncbi:hypothetical protein ACQ86N_21805 [Puia sp. P3]|uniref:hypothetical protein n=1 Tax=Puia sp. P3 TaxID=3423952 RepID=UPI003D6732D9
MEYRGKDTSRFRRAHPHRGIEHFSNYSAGTSFRIFPATARIKTGKQQLFRLVISGVYPDGKKYNGRDKDRDYWKNHTVQWSVNRVVGGDSKIGYITPGAPPDGNSALYFAPAVLPPAPVDIIAKYIGYVPLADGSFAENVVVVATVDIYDEFHYTFTGRNRLGHLLMIDSSACDIQVASSGAVGPANIHNYPPGATGRRRSVSAAMTIRTRTDGKAWWKSKE